MNHWTATLHQKKHHGIVIWFSLTTSLQTWIALRRRRRRLLAASTRSSSSTQTLVAQGRGANPLGFKWRYGERTIKVYGNIQVFDDFENSLTKNVGFLGKMCENHKWFLIPTDQKFDKCSGATAVTRITMCELSTYSECGNDMFIKNQQNILRVESWTNNGLTLTMNREVVLALDSKWKNTQYVAGRWTR